MNWCWLAVVALCGNTDLATHSHGLLAHLLYRRSIWFWLKPVSSWMAMMSSGWSWRDDLELPMVSGECCYQGGWRDSDSPAAAYCSHTTLSTTAATLQIGDKAGPRHQSLHTTLHCVQHHSTHQLGPGHGLASMSSVFTAARLCSLSTLKCQFWQTFRLLSANHQSCNL